jgi:DNA mismatch repair protein MutL
MTAVGSAWRLDACVRLLPPDVADKIAAGEVVERPASVVKELVENALDADARHVRIDLEEAGIGLIAVSDDGIGMSAQDAVAAFQRHATSKITCADDLFHVTTLGFRGEALASIAAVSTTTLITRRAADDSATLVVVRGGSVDEVRTVGSAPGTRVEVADLFGNTPARRKFLKAPATEVGHVTELVTRTALAWPSVTFVLRHGTRTLLEVAAVADGVERLAQVFGRERAATMLSLQGRSPAGDIRGWLTGSHVSLPTARQIYTYVNGRFVRDKLVNHAVVAGYSTLLMHGRYPAAVVFIDVPLEDVDVNVHPAKSEVRFRRGGAVHDLITRTVMERLRTQRPATGPAEDAGTASACAPSAANDAPLRMVMLPAGPPPGWPAAVEPAPSRAPGQEAPEVASMPRAPASPAAVAIPVGALASAAAHGAVAPGFFSTLRIIGQIFDGYILCESADTLLVIDQHAAHERVTFERLRAAYADGGVGRQRLLIPTVVDVGAQAAPIVGQRLADLEALGFELEPFGGSSFAVRAVPALLSDSDPAALVRDLADELTDVGRSRRIVQAAESVLARLACHSAVRVGQTLGPAQIRALLVAMDSVEFAGNCPHGRPAFLAMPRGDLERLFKRT